MGGAGREVGPLLLALALLHAGLEDLFEEALDGGGVEGALVRRHQRVEHRLLAHRVVLGRAHGALQATNLGGHRCPPREEPQDL